MCLTVPSILVQLNRYEEAVELINNCRGMIKRSSEKLLLSGYLDLMLASIYVYNNSKVKYGDVESLILKAKETF